MYVRKTPSEHGARSLIIYGVEAVNGMKVLCFRKFSSERIKHKILSREDGQPLAREFFSTAIRYASFRGRIFLFRERTYRKILRKNFV